MTNFLDDKTYIILLKGGYRVSVTEEQAMSFSKELAKKTKGIFIDNAFINAENIIGILPIAKVDMPKAKETKEKPEYPLLNEKRAWEMTTEELKEEIGNLEEELESIARIANLSMYMDIRKIEDLFLQGKRAVTWDNNIKRVRVPEYPHWMKKIDCLGELKARRERAERINKETMEHINPS